MKLDGQLAFISSRQVCLREVNCHKLQRQTALITCYVISLHGFIQYKQSKSKCMQFELQYHT